MFDIEEYFRQLLEQHRSVDIADAELKKAMAEDAELRSQYNDWCHEVGSTERLGFRDFCDEYLSDQESVWESLTDYDDE